MYSLPSASALGLCPRPLPSASALGLCPRPLPSASALGPFGAGNFFALAIQWDTIYVVSAAMGSA